MPFALPRAETRRRLALVLLVGGSMAATAHAGVPAGVAVAAARGGRQQSDLTIRVLLARVPSPPPADATSRGVYGGRQYRGRLDVVADAGAFAVINRVDLNEYLRGVLPGEIGSRDPRDRAALQAQAVAARSYAAARMGERRPLYDVVATVADQVYGGMAVERPETDTAVRDTRGLVLTWADRIITAPYHAHGGTITAALDEVFWRRASEPYLRPVDDRLPDGRCYCDAGGARTWERRFTLPELSQRVAQYGRELGLTSRGEVRGARIAAQGASGRVTVLELDTSAGLVLVRGNDIRLLLRSGGDILPTTRFSLEAGPGQVVLRGVGNGHGVGMSQWGAIGRARAGQDARAILAAYYPGTRLAPLR